ncbi:hypothetical protein JCM18750_37970 [Halostagnicola bangensis]
MAEPVPLDRFDVGAEPASLDWDVVEEPRAEGKQTLESLADAATEFEAELIEAIQHRKPAETIRDGL